MLQIFARGSTANFTIRDVGDRRLIDDGVPFFFRKSALDAVAARKNMVDVDIFCSELGQS